MSEVVVDASVIVMVAIVDRYTSRAAALLRHWRVSGFDILAPPLLLPETTNAVYKQVRSGSVSLTEAQLALRLFATYAVQIVDRPDLQNRALDLAARFVLRASYDAQYLALADLLGCPLWTADERLFNSVRRALPWVHWLGDSAAVSNLVGPIP